MWCDHCNLQTNEKICPNCGKPTTVFKPIRIFWCDTCNVPVLINEDDLEKHFCPNCNNKLKYLSSDLRPVFPEERLLFEVLTGNRPNEYLNNSVWANKNNYFIDGKKKILKSEIFSNIDINSLIQRLNELKEKNSYEFFNQNMQKFIEINRQHLNLITLEAQEFIQNEVQNFQNDNIIISFSGGKDSTVTADLVMNALSDPEIVHIFGDTTLEFPLTIEYVNRYRQNHPYSIFCIARNEDQDFLEVCKDIGPPARMMRWCCSMFKTGPISRVINSFFRNEQVLTFYGIRKQESVSRSKYSRVEDNAKAIKIQQQTVASPIFYWKDIDIWLYLLANNVDFNEAYRLGYDRVGCWCCPNNTLRGQFLSRIYMPEKSQEWRDFLIDFAKQIGKPDPEVYVDSGNWKARQGGNGLEVSKNIELKSSECTSEENAIIYNLERPYGPELINLFIPFGVIREDLGQKILNEVVIVDDKTKIPILSLQPYMQDSINSSVKIRFLTDENIEELQRMAGYQVRKFNACRQCLKCESLCRNGAISIINGQYIINSEKCTHCKKCMKAQFIRGGCLMYKYLKAK